VGDRRYELGLLSCRLLFFFLVIVPATCRLFIFSITCENQMAKTFWYAKHHNYR